jgi:hypothetical protein
MASEPSGIATRRESQQDTDPLPAAAFVGALWGQRGCICSFIPGPVPTKHGLSLSSTTVGGS